MATQILAGSKGVYKPVKTTIEKFGDCNFTVTQDTCSSLDYVVGRFTDGFVETRIDKSRITWTDLKTKDFQGA